MAAPWGFVAAGGQSQRMGQDKALLPWHGTTLLEHAIARLRGACGEVRILCGPEPRYQDHAAPLVVDRVTGVGPLAGLAAALAASGAAGALLLAVDVPRVPIALLQELVRLGPGHDIVVPVTALGPQPLCALYGPACAGALEVSLAVGSHRMTGFWNALRVRRVEARELQRFGDPERLFLNLNTPAEHARGQAGE
jgi:molybdopterin-guanine dinucleotide biosynthesis protein A